MQVYMLKDVEKLGMAGQIIKVSDGYATNFLIPRKLAIKIGEQDLAFFKTKEKKVVADKQVLSSKAAMLAEKIKNMHLTIKKKAHDEGKLYGSISPDEIVDLLKEKEIVINRKQVEFPKAVRSVGDYSVIIKLSSKLKPEFLLKVVALNK
ncbi:50S ribosomal protein L9 [Candidatus Babeliales bacterium]|nr:50S ribosomal protein L9 [Candidatus Babeliales bacterium]MCF7899109.1 50S ribosomal protein L9 [Candidatus Babeliales bacterium]